MKIIAPFMSCIVNMPLSADEPSEFDAAVAEGYVEIYVVTPNGIIKHHKLRGTNRFLRLKVDSIPGTVIPSMREEINFLPAGKIPYQLLQQIEAFFRKVMEVKKDQLEAMIWVLYNEAQGYHLFVPDQTISKASVRYDWDGVPAGSSIVCDIHSHNTMGAFFSGTDNNDDRNAISFSGVFGNLDRATPATVWRFNYRDKKYEAKLEDIFEQVTHPEIEIPDDWISQVKTVSYSGYQVGQGVNRSGAPGGYAQGGYLGSYLGNHRRSSHVMDDEEDRSHVGKGKSGGSDPKKANDPSSVSVVANAQTAEQGSGFNVYDFMNGNPDEELSLTDLILGRQAQVMAQEALLDHTGQPLMDQGSLLDTSEGESTIMDNIRFDELMINKGGRVATSFCDINDRMVDLEGEDELLVELASDMVGLMEEEHKNVFFRQIYQSLSQREKDKIAQNGL